MANLPAPNSLPHYTATYALTPSLAASYLERLLLSPTLLSSPPTLSLLSTVLLAHHEQVPKDTSPLHVPESDWQSPTPIILGSSFGGMPVGVDAYEGIVRKHRGAFCFGLNPSFASLLRTLGYRVSEMVARCYQALGNDPRTHELGWKWGTWSHEVLVVDWEGSGERYLVDVGFGGGGCATPMPLVDGATIPGLNSYDAFRIHFGPLPQSPDTPVAIDVIPGWTIYRRVAPVDIPVLLPITDDSPGYWSPQYHFHLASVPLIDFTLYHLYSAFHPNAAFTGFFLITKLIPGTGGARRSIMFNAKNAAEGGTKAKVHTTGGLEARGSTADRDVVWVEMETGAMRKHLEEEWGFKFPVVGA